MTVDWRRAGAGCGRVSRAFQHAYMVESGCGERQYDEEGVGAEFR